MLKTLVAQVDLANKATVERTYIVKLESGDKKNPSLDILKRLANQRVDGLADLAESLRVLGPPYRFHGELLHGALRDWQDNAITWQLMHVLEKLERDVE